MYYKKQMFLQHYIPFVKLPWQLLHIAQSWDRKQKHTLTGENGGEEYVVGEGDEAALPKRIEDAVLVCELLPLLRNLLLVPKEKDR